MRPDGFAVGIDAAPEMIARARELAAREGWSVEYRVADFASPAVQGARHVAAQVLGNRPETDDSLGRLLWHAGFRGITSGRLLHGMLAGARGEKR